MSKTAVITAVVVWLIAVGVVSADMITAPYETAQESWKPYAGGAYNVGGATGKLYRWEGDGHVSGGAANGCGGNVSEASWYQRGFNDYGGWHVEDSRRVPAINASPNYYSCSGEYYRINEPAALAGRIKPSGAYECDTNTCYATTKHSFIGPGTAKRVFYTSTSPSTRTCANAFATPGGHTCTGSGAGETPDDP